MLGTVGEGFDKGLSWFGKKMSGLFGKSRGKKQPDDKSDKAPDTDE